MKNIISATIFSLSVLSATPTLAGALDLILDNTVVLTIDAGGQEIVSKLNYEPDGSILVDGSASGSWQEEDGKLCSTLRGGPNGEAQTACSSLDDIAATKVGDTWSFSPAEGVNMKGELIAGQ
jgi:hypothetical protein